MNPAALIRRWWRDRQAREWFVIGDYSPFRGPHMLIGGPYARRHARREMKRWCRIHPCAEAAITRATKGVAKLPRYILDDFT